MDPRVYAVYHPNTCGINDCGADPPLSCGQPTASFDLGEDNHDLSTEVSGMTHISASIEKHHQKIIGGLVLVIAFFLVACTFHDVIPVCHYLFGCDHAMHTL